VENYRYIATNLKMMKTTHLFGTILAFLLTTAIGFAQTGVNASALVSFPKTEIDMGVLEQGQPQTVVFKLVSYGNDFVQVRHVKPFCGCTGVEFPKELVGSGETAEIKVTYDAKEVGSFRKKVIVYTNAFNGTEVTLWISGRVREAKTTE